VPEHVVKRGERERKHVVGRRVTTSDMVGRQTALAKVLSTLHPRLLRAFPGASLAPSGASLALINNSGFIHAANPPRRLQTRPLRIWRGDLRERQP